jgi:DNA-binding MarR family transcriptional regulator
MTDQVQTGSRRDEALHAIEREVGALIRRVRRVIGERARSIHPDLQPSAYLILTYLNEEDDVRSSQLVENFGIDKGAISRQISSLADLGLVERFPDPEDGRATRIRLTDDAKARIQSVSERRWGRFGQRLADWSDDDLAGFAAILQHYNESLDSQDEVSGGS